MSERAAMLSALERIEQLRGQLHTLPRDNAEGWKRQYVASRRELQDAFALFNKACSAWLAEGVEDPDARQLRQLSGAFRTRLADHQARFPVVSIDPGDSGYWTSMNAIDASLRDLVTFVRALRR